MQPNKSLSVITNIFKKQKARMILVCSSIFVIAIMMTGVMLITNRVTVIDKGQTKTILSSSEDISQILNSHGYELSIDDSFTFSGFVDNKGEVTVHRAFPVKINTYTESTTVNIAGGTVEDAISKSGVMVNEFDIVEPKLDTPLAENSQIKITRVDYETTTTPQPIPYQTVKVNSSSILKGNTVVSNEGTEGTLNVTTKKMFVDGQLSETYVTGEEVVKQPVDRVLTVGTKPTNTISQLNPPEGFTLNDKGIPTSYKSVISGKSAAYSAKPGALTASGRKAMVGYVAVDPKVIPYGTKLYIKSTDSSHVYGYAIAADTGTALLNGHITVDLFFPDYASSCKWGIHNVNIYVLD